MITIRILFIKSDKHMYSLGVFLAAQYIHTSPPETYLRRSRSLHIEMLENTPPV